MRRPSSVRIGNVLQVRIARGEPACGGDGLVEGAVNAAGRRIDQRRQRIHVRRLELREATEVEDLLRQRMLASETREHVYVGRQTGLAAADSARRDLQLLEQHFAKLRRRVDVEFAAGERVNLGEQCAQARVELGAHRRQPLRIDSYAAKLHAREHGDQRHLDLGEEPLGSLLGELLAQHRGDTHDRARALGRGLADAVLAVFEPRDERSTEILEGEVFDAMALARRVDDVGCDPDVELRSARAPRPRRASRTVHALQVCTDLGDVSQSRAKEPGRRRGSRRRA